MRNNPANSVPAGTEALQRKWTQNMTGKTILLSAASLAAVAFAGAPALAAGTQQGTSITNNVTVSYQVGGVSQTDVTASNTFVVDRKINLTVSEASGGATSVSPGQSGAVTTFTVTNSSNDTIDLGLAATQQTGGAGRHGGTDSYNISVPQIYRETGAQAGFQSSGANADTAVTFLDEVAPDANVTVYIVGNVPLGLASGAVATVTLTATAQDNAGVAIPETVGANTAGVDTVFADTLATGGNTARDGKALDRDDYLVSAANLTAAKNSVIISDPLNGTTNPKMIPGATLQYCIIVSNATGSATATNVALTDVIPVQTTFDTSYAIRVNGTAAGGVCDASSGSAIVGGYDTATRTVSGALSDIAAGAARTLLFRVTVN